MANSKTLEVECITGYEGTGKTYALLERIAALVQDAKEIPGMLVICATPQACESFKKRLEVHMRQAKLQLSAQDIDIRTARELALELLSDEEAQSWTKRDPRLMTDYEELFLMEDMKTSGIRSKRLREMLRFFYRSWTELADDDPDWLLRGEETKVHTLLKTNLALSRTFLEPELSNIAVNYLREHPQARAQRGYAHVLVDDYQCYSRASQQLTQLIATQSLTVAGDVNACVEVYDSYPYADGLAELAEKYPDAKHVTLETSYRSNASRQAACALLQEACMEKTVTNTIKAAVKDSEQAVVLKAQTPADEFEQIAAYVAGIQEEDPSAQVIIAAPNDTWGRNIVTALTKHDITAEALPSKQAVRGDVRDNNRCIPTRILVGLDLVAHPKRAEAWRCWCGFGDYLTNSAVFSDIRSFSVEHGTNLLDAIKKFDQGEENATCSSQSELKHILNAYQSGNELIDQVRDMKGMELLNEITRLITGNSEAVVPERIAELCLDANGKIGSEDDAATLIERAYNRLIAPRLRNAEALAVLPYDQLVGTSPDVLIIAGFVNGFIPAQIYFDGTALTLEQQEKMHAVDTRRVYSFASKANKTLVVSYFTTVDLETAGNLKLKIEKIRVEDNVRVCTIAASEFLQLLHVEN